MYWEKASCFCFKFLIYHHDLQHLKGITQWVDEKKHSPKLKLSLTFWHEVWGHNFRSMGTFWVCANSDGNGLSAAWTLVDAGMHVCFLLFWGEYTSHNLKKHDQLSMKCKFWFWSISNDSNQLEFCNGHQASVTPKSILQAPHAFQEGVPVGHADLLLSWAGQDKTRSYHHETPPLGRSSLFYLALNSSTASKSSTSNTAPNVASEHPNK